MSVVRLIAPDEQRHSPSEGRRRAYHRGDKMSEKCGLGVRYLAFFDGNTVV